MSEKEEKFSYIKTIRIFYSWQNTTDKKTNRSFLKTCLNKSLKNLKRVYPQIEIKLDEATRNTKGAVDIAQTIFSKIDESDIFIADVSEVYSEDQIHFSNSNVLIELGYAAATIGWGNILMIFNTNYGNINDLPFDINHRRVFPYHLDQELSDKKEVAQNVIKSLTNILSIPINENKNLENASVNKLITYFANRISYSKNDMNLIMYAIFKSANKELGWGQISKNEFYESAKKINPHDSPISYREIGYSNWFEFLHDIFRRINTRIFEMILFQEHLNENIISLLINIQNDISLYENLEFNDRVKSYKNLEVISLTIQDLYTSIFALYETFRSEYSKYFNFTGKHFTLPKEYESYLFKE